MMMRQAALVSGDPDVTLPVSSSSESQDRRWARRKEVATGARILGDGLSIPLPCVVRDLSSTGARLELVKSDGNLIGGRAKLPSAFTLIMHMDRMEVDCAIAWRRSGIVGVRFISTPRPIGRAARTV